MCAEACPKQQQQQHTTHNTQHTTHNTQHTTHNTQHTTHNTQHTTHNTQTHKHTNTQTHKQVTNTQTHKLSVVAHVCLHTNTQTHKHTMAQTHKLHKHSGGTQTWQTTTNTSNVHKQRTTNNWHSKMEEVALFWDSWCFWRLIVHLGGVAILQH